MNVASFPLACQVIHLSHDMLEVRFQQAYHLRPGQLLRFEREDKNTLYGRIDSLRVDHQRPSEEGIATPIIAQIHVLLGEADLTLNQAHVLSTDGLNQDVASLIGTPDFPLSIGQGLTADFRNYQTLTLVYGSHLNDKLATLAHLLEALNPYQHLIVIDPLGIVQEELLDKAPKTFAHVIKGGIDAALSLQNVGIKHFLSVLSTMLPDVIRNEAIQLLAEVLPIGQNFIPFRDLLRVETLTERKGDGPSRQALSMKTPLLNCLYDIDRQRVFADSPREVLSLPNLLSESVTVIDLSPLSEPWKSLFYEEICLQILGNAGSDMMPVLIYPENYLSDFSDYVKKLNEADLSALTLASPYFDKGLLPLADTRVYWNALGDQYIEGSLTFGLPIQLDLSNPPSTWGEFEQDISFKAHNPIQARYSSQSAPIAAPTPAIQEDAPYTVTLDDSDVPLWYDSPVADTATGQEQISTGYYLDPEAEPFDSILGPLHEFDSNIPPSNESAYAENIEKVATSEESYNLPDYQPSYQTDELGGNVLRSEPEFISGDDLKAHAPQLADAMLQALQSENIEPVTMGAETAFNDNPATSDNPEIAAEDDFHFEFAWDDTEPKEIPLNPEAPVYTVPPEQDAPVIENVPFSPEPVPGIEKNDTILTEPPPIVSKAETLENNLEGLEEGHLNYQVGDRVISDKYGSGIIQKLIPMDSTTAVHVLFDNGAKRTIVPSATNLQKT